MPTIQIAVADRITTTDTAQIQCGTEYTLSITLDSEWGGQPVNCEIESSLYDGSTERTTVPVSQGTATLPAQEDTYGVSIQLTTWAGLVKLTSTPAFIACTPEPEADESVEYPPDFDVYDAMVQYINDVMGGTVDEATLATELQAIETHMSRPAEDFPSPAYRLAVSAPIRFTRLSGQIKPKSGSTVQIDETSIVSNSLRITTSCMDDDYIIPGAAPSKELNVNLIGIDPDTLEDAELTLTFRIQLLSGVWYDVPLGKFYIADIESIGTDGSVPVTAYDGMYKAGAITVAMFNAPAGRYYTPQEIVTRCAQVLGLPYTGDVSGYTNGGKAFEVAALGAEVASIRDLLMHTAQAVCAFACVDRFGALRLVQITPSAEPVAAITKHQRTSAAINRAEYKLFSVTTSISFLDTDGTRRVYTVIAETLRDIGIKAEMPENPLWGVMQTQNTGRNRAYEILHCIKAVVDNGLSGVVYAPYTAQVYGDPAVELFERRTLTAHGSAYTAPITSYEWAYNGMQQLAACGKEAIAGIVEKQLKKSEYAIRVNAADDFYNDRRSYTGHIIQSIGHLAMATYTHDELAEFTHGELSGDEPISYDGRPHTLIGG